MRRYQALNLWTTKPRRRARGFTLIELLVVMGIIIFLVAVMAMVMRNFITTAKEAKTKAILTKLDGLITKRVNDLTLAIKAQDTSGSKYIAQVDPIWGLSPLQLAGNYPPRAKVLGHKLLFRNAFPQNLAEATAAGITLPSNYNSSNDSPETQSAEALFLSLTQGSSFGPPTVDATDFKSGEIDDTDNDGLKEFVDGWGQPIRFYRWPTRLFRPAPPGSETTAQSLNNGNYVYGVKVPPSKGNTNPGASAYYNGQVGISANLFFSSIPFTDLGKDPGDPLGITMGATWTYNGNVPMTPAKFETTYPKQTPDTWSLPLVVSAGIDGVLGIYEPHDTAHFGHLAQPNYSELDGMLDNFSNQNLQP